MRVLFVTQIRAWPLDCGGAQRTFALIRALASKHRVTLAVTRPASADQRAAIEAGYAGLVSDFIYVDGGPESESAVQGGFVDALTNWLPPAFRKESAPWRRMIDAQRDKFDAAFCRQSLLAPSLMDFGLHRVVFDCDDLLFLYVWRNRAEREHALRSVRAGVGTARTYLAEQIITARSAQTLVCSLEDSSRLLTPRKTLVPNAVTLEAGPRTEREGDTVVFVGNAAYRPNYFGLRWFIATVWPLVRDARPNARLRIVGLEATYERLPFARTDGVELHANVPSVKPYVEGATVSVAPIFTGGGTRIKILESIGYGTPAVSTPMGASGLTELLDASTGLDVVEGSAAMAARIVEVLANPAPAIAAAQRGSALVASRYRWEDVTRPVAENFATWVGAPGD